MKRPTNQNALFAQEQFLVYQKLLDEHNFFSQDDKIKMQQEADYWRTQYEEAKDCKIIKNLGLKSLPKT